MQFFYAPTLPASDTFTLDADESRHCLRVLRKNVGDHLDVVDGKGNLCHVEIISDKGKLCELKIISCESGYGIRSFKVAIAIAIPKNTERIEWFLEKATEIGIDDIYPMATEKTERTRLNTARLGKILVSAMKQSGRAYLPVLHEPQKFSALLGSGELSLMQRFIAVCGTEDTAHLKNIYQKGTDAIVMTGPEGDFTPGEVKQAVASGYKLVSLGTARLRVETAGLAACHIINLMN